MSPERILSREALSANRTRIRLVARVDAGMPTQIVVAAESEATVAATVRFLAGMSPHVWSNVRMPIEHFAADITRELGSGFRRTHFAPIRSDRLEERSGSTTAEAIHMWGLIHECQMVRPRRTLEREGLRGRDGLALWLAKVPHSINVHVGRQCSKRLVFRSSLAVEH